MVYYENNTDPGILKIEMIVNVLSWGQITWLRKYGHLIYLWPLLPYHSVTEIFK